LEGEGIGAGSAHSEELWVLRLEGEGIGADFAQMVASLEEVESILLLSASYCELGGESNGAGAAHRLLCVDEGDPDLVLSVLLQLLSVSLLR